MARTSWSLLLFQAYLLGKLFDVTLYSSLTFLLYAQPNWYDARTQLTNFLLRNHGSA